jgi:hypothetical protein
LSPRHGGNVRPCRKKRNTGRTASSRASTLTAREFVSQQWTFARGIRFVNGLAEKIGGFVALNLVSAITSIMGSYIRSIYSQRIGANIFTMLGTPSNLYSLVGSALTNVTPLDTATHARRRTAWKRSMERCRIIR